MSSNVFAGTLNLTQPTIHYLYISTSSSSSSSYTNFMATQNFRAHIFCMKWYIYMVEGFQWSLPQF